MKISVTGAAGQLGTDVAVELKKRAIPPLAMRLKL